MAVVEDSTDDGILMLKPQSTCAGCGGSCLWKRLGALRLPALDASSGLRLGDRVEVTVPAGYALYGACVAYGLPLGGLLGGAAAAALFDTGDGSVLVGALAGLVVAFALTVGLRARVERAVLARCMIAKCPDPEC